MAAADSEGAGARGPEHAGCTPPTSRLCPHVLTCEWGVVDGSEGVIRTLGIVPGTQEAFLYREE